MPTSPGNANIPWFQKRERPAVWIHSQDALERRVEDGQEVFVFNDRGRIKIRAHVTDDIMPGTVCLLQGQWPCLDVDGTDMAGSANVLTSRAHLDRTDRAKPGLTNQLYPGAGA